ncbi:class I SAM-dependent methyltransferase [Flexithrix dorotheae]|uniref:class I SAM-dependent methyltransferase n=1 Tax=Flexithrix dorotheae TaxID=70993 RepID=UPI000363FC7D|nr:class I SAM-dependent methyltransferase [Flexithrix dorotheae]
MNDEKQNIKTAYNMWAAQYDSNINKTRDLESVSLRETLQNLDFNNCLEVGCGTGKNTVWLISKTDKIVAVDFSEKMLSVAKDKIQSEKVTFIQADITKEWSFVNNGKFDLTIFSLILEHVEDLEQIFEKLNQVVAEMGYVYIGELHPFKQYNGSKAKFETDEGFQTVTCFTHHISDYTRSASKYDFNILKIEEYFEDGNRSNIPRILTLLLQKKSI